MDPNAPAPGLHSGGDLLAESDNVSVFHCSCGNIHLQVGAVCLTMQLDELHEVGATIVQALRQIPVRPQVSARAVN